MNEIAGTKATVATIGGVKESLVFGARYDLRYGDDQVLRGARLDERARNGDLLFDVAKAKVRVRPSTIDAITRIDAIHREPKETAVAFVERAEKYLGAMYGSWIETDAGQKALADAAREDQAGRNGKVSRKRADPTKVVDVLSTIYPGVVATSRTTSLDELDRLARLSDEDRAHEDALARGVALAESLASEPAFARNPDAIAEEVARQIPELAAPAGAPSGLSPAEEIALDLRRTPAKGRPYGERNQVWRCGSCKRRTRAAFCENGHARVDAPAGKRREDRGAK